MKTKFYAHVEEIGGADWATAGAHPDKKTARELAKLVIAQRKALGLGYGKYRIVIRAEPCGRVISHA